MPYSNEEGHFAARAEAQRAVELGRKAQGAGRPRSSKKVPHVARETFPARYPIHVTLRVVEGLGDLREVGRYKVIGGALSNGCNRFGFRVIHHSTLGNH